MSTYPNESNLSDLAQTVDDIFRLCSEVIVHFNQGTFNGLDQLTHCGPETYTVKMLEKLAHADAVCDAMLLNLGPGAEVEAIESQAASVDPSRTLSPTASSPSVERSSSTASVPSWLSSMLAETLAGP
ncbi:hypothetical protein H9P43_008449 [Blastocladiella emersonii ATCC 22665]|nr:hypothetical protein H9P43_008449 [Blastocladiella emersonii ATCC 22665]